MKKDVIKKMLLTIIMIAQLSFVVSIGYRSDSNVEFISNINYHCNYNCKTKLNIVSKYGDNEAYHPKVVNFEKQWNGYKYWMAYTPYPAGDDSKENPHIVASNNLIKWETPKGLTNPLDERYNDGETEKYNSDTHLLYNPDLDRLECFWRFVNDKDNEVIIYRSYTKDGINFSEKDVFIKSNNRKAKDYVSPAILYENGIYEMWYVDKKEIQYMETFDGISWTKPVIVKVNYKDKELKTWHLDVVYTPKGYEMIMVAYKKGRKTMNLYYSYSENKTQNWSEAEKILGPTTGTIYWDNLGLYRSCMIYENGVYVVFYSGIGNKNTHGIGIMYGKDINKLISVDIDFDRKENSNEMIELIEKTQI